MVINIFLYLLIIHILIEYYFQSKFIKIEDNKEIKFLLKHAGIYTAIASVCIIPIISITIIKYVIIFSVIHFLIEISIFYLNKVLKKEFVNKDKILYIIKQIIHIITIYVLAYIFNKEYQLEITYDLFIFSSITVNEILKFMLAILLIVNPVNYTFKIVLANIKPNDSDMENNMKTGKLIGSLERMLVIILLIANQYTAIGLIFTAKSITRYEKTADSKKFAEYYLIGTLFSMLSTLIIYLVIFRL